MALQGDFLSPVARPPFDEEEEDIFTQMQRRVLDRAELESAKADDFRGREAQTMAEARQANDLPTAMATEADEDPFEDMLQKFFRGATSRTAQQEEDDFLRFERENRPGPASRFLQGLLGSVSSSLTGQRYISIRDRLRTRFEANREAIKDRQRIAVQAAAQVVGLRKARDAETGRNQRHAATLADRQDARDQATEVANRRISLAEDRYGLAVQALDLQRQKFEAAGEKLPDTLLESARLMLEETVGELGPDASLEERTERLQMIVDAANNIHSKRAQELAKARGANRAPLRRRFQVKQFTDGFGRVQLVRFDLDSGTAINEKGQALTAQQLKDFSPVTLQRLDASEVAVGQMRTLAGIAEQNPELFNIGTATKLALPGAVKTLAEAYGILSPEERSLDSLMRELTIGMVRAATGAQATDRERDFIRELLPSVSNPVNFRLVLGLRASMSEAIVLRERLGLNKKDLDLEAVFSGLNTRLEKAKTDPNFRVMSAGRMLLGAARAAGRPDIVALLESEDLL